jgi:superfamily II DNA or RNA helicase
MDGLRNWRVQFAWFRESGFFFENEFPFLRMPDKQMALTLQGYRFSKQNLNNVSEIKARLTVRP